MLTAVRDYLHTHWPVSVAVVALLAGLFTAALGVTGLTSAAPGNLGQVSRRVRRVISR